MAANDKKQDTAEKPQTPRQRYRSWPSKGGFDGPQPWDLKALKIDPTDLEPGERDTLSPVVIDHGLPILTSGESGAPVLELAHRLADLGYPTSIARGQNAFNVYDDTVAQAVDLFRGEWGIEEDPHLFGGLHPAAREAAARHVGPYTWEALIRASDRERKKRDREAA